MPHKRAFIVLGAAALLLVALPVVTAFGGSASPSRPGVGSLAASSPLGSGFTYQGRLTESGQPANGPYDMQFILYDSASGGAQIGSTQTIENVNVAAGVFTVTLDFGVDAFNGDARWLEIGVKPDSPGGAFTVLSPRQPVTPTPYASFAKMAGGLALPFEGTADTDSPGAAFTVEQTGSGVGIFAERSTGGAAPAIYGVNTGAGAGVKGETSGGVGVEGSVSGDGVGGRFLGGGGETDALQVGEGAIRVVGNNMERPAFVLTAEDSGESNTCDVDGADNAVIIDSPYANGDEFAIILVTLRNTLGTPYPITVAYGACSGSPNNWAIITTQAASIDGDQFNVLIINDDSTG